jgi:hypothetical protein
MIIYNEIQRIVDELLTEVKNVAGLREEHGGRGAVASMSLVGRLFFENQLAPAANAWAETRAHRQAERRRTAIELQERTAEVLPARVYARDVELPSVIVKDGAAEALLGSDCVICLATFEPQDECNVLPCTHTFHTNWCVHTSAVRVSVRWSVSLWATPSSL